jgi:hypothetical protein
MLPYQPQSSTSTETRCSRRIPNLQFFNLSCFTHRYSPVERRQITPERSHVLHRELHRHFCWRHILRTTNTRRSTWE